MFSLHTINHIIINHKLCILVTYISIGTHTQVYVAEPSLSYVTELNCNVQSATTNTHNAAPIDKFSSTTSECVYMKC